MSFDPHWLALREPADLAARDPAMLEDAAAHVRARAGAQADAPVVVDLGCGTGATARALGPGLPATARWRLVDSDAGLLARAAEATGAGAAPCLADLGALESLPLAGAHMVTASALLDLMPGGWVDGLAARLAAAGLGFYAALSYDGRMEWTPALPDDAGVTAAFNTHQRGDKGLGPALGPDAGHTAADLFRAHGFAVRLAASPWRLGPASAALHAALVEGVAQAAGEAGFAGAAQWGQARRAACASGSCVVGHVDLLALPAA